MWVDADGGKETGFRQTDVCVRVRVCVYVCDLPD